MGTVKCERCGGHAEANSIEEGYPLIDHAVGLSSGHPCEAGKATLIMVGETQAPKTEPEPKVEETKKSSKAIKSSEKEAS